MKFDPKLLYWRQCIVEKGFWHLNQLTVDSVSGSGGTWKVMQFWVKMPVRHNLTYRIISFIKAYVWKVICWAPCLTRSLKSLLVSLMTGRRELRSNSCCTLSWQSAVIYLFYNWFTFSTAGSQCWESLSLPRSGSRVLNFYYKVLQLKKVKTNLFWSKIAV